MPELRVPAEALDGADEETPVAGEPAAGVSLPTAEGRLAIARRWVRSHAIALAGLPLAAIVLFALYLHEARTAPLNGDGAGNALQAWDMLHGNLLLSHWTVSDVSFYLTELPEYMLVEAVHGLNGDVVHWAAALSYTLAVLLACWLARGRATGREALARVLIVLVIMVAAPAPGVGTVVLLDSPDHFGTCVPLLVIYLAYDRLPRRWYTPLVLFALLVWAGTSDSTVLFLGVAGLATATGLRLWYGRGERRYESWLLAAIVIAAAVANQAPHLIHRLGGFLQHPPDMTFNPSDTMPVAFWHSVSSFLQLFGADFFGLSVATPSAHGSQTIHVVAVIAILHLIGTALVVVALFRVVRRLREDTDFDAAHSDVARSDAVNSAVKAMTVGILLNLAALVFSSQYQGGGREIAGVLPLAAVVAARTLAPGLTSVKHIGALAAATAVFAGVLVYHAGQQSQPPYAHKVEAWLKQNGYTSGIGGYWASHSITVGSGGGIWVIPVNTGPRGIQEYDWESKSTWYDPAKNYANFLVIDGTTPTALAYATPQRAIKQFGPPVRTVDISGWEVMVWNKNLLEEVPRG